MIKTTRTIARSGLRLPARRSYSVEGIQEPITEEMVAIENPLPESLKPVTFKWNDCTQSIHDVVPAHNHSHVHNKAQPAKFTLNNEEGKK